MNLVSFCCRARVASFFRHRRLQRILLLALGIVGAAIYSWLFSSLLEQAQAGATSLSVNKVLEYANLLLLALIILKGFFPAYVPKTEIIPRIYPVSAIERFRTELIVELVSPFYFILLNFLILLFLMSPAYTALHLLQSVMVLLTAHITLRALQVLVERKIRWRHHMFFAAAVMAAAFVAIQVQEPTFTPAYSWLKIIVHMAALGFLTASNYFLEASATEPRRKVVSHSSSTRRSLSWRLFKNHKLARQMLIFGMVFKALILGADALSYSKEGKHILDEIVTLWLFVGPLVIFSYVFNNIWGFYRNLWLTIERSSGNYKDFIKASLLPLRVPLLLDAVLTFLYVALFNHQHALFIVLMYTGSILLLIPFGLIASFVSPKAVKGGIFSFSAKVSYLYNFLAIALFAMLFLPLLHPVLYLLYPLLIGGTFFALAAVLKEYPRYKYKLFQTLYKTEG
ncbi:hypothetical protein CLV24_12056 [Pontibacter ummariensis]|uniref:Uncharacterized protein n=1 Tax=Pontibacter ummariensis TaxID=1610492 RepID=A0A239J5U2_9BACT|nr:hypothetical protein [Pontibacter ummariensis]PRY08889.1 hypothetical protein CLV24_12056 [Pontibacter ummariensis]SNT01042.1 hypothetical protein SAMN06296052_12055 [Pontibacter ummariensis]